MAEREDDIDNEDIVVWHTFGLTHNPRIEGRLRIYSLLPITGLTYPIADFPVMPVEIHRIDLKPADFFSRNPAIDVPSSKNLASKLHNVGGLVNGFVAEIPQNPDVEHRTLSTNDEIPKSIRKCCV